MFTADIQLVISHGKICKFWALLQKRTSNITLHESIIVVVFRGIFAACPGDIEWPRPSRPKTQSRPPHTR